MIGQNGWNLDENSFNSSNFKFIVDNNNLITEDGNIFTIKFKVKENVEVPQVTTIKVTNIVAGTGEKEISADNNEISLNIENEPIVEEKITSNKYNVEDSFISRIIPKTTVSKFKENVETSQSIVFIDKDGNILGENDIISTGTIIKVGNTLEYTSVVIGDTDGDGAIGINDLAKLKLHYIEHTLLTGPYLKAGDLDDNGETSINDIAQIKLTIIGLKEIK